MQNLAVPDTNLNLPPNFNAHPSSYSSPLTLHSYNNSPEQPFNIVREQKVLNSRDILTTSSSSYSEMGRFEKKLRFAADLEKELMSSETLPACPTQGPPSTTNVSQGNFNAVYEGRLATSGGILKTTSPIHIPPRESGLKTEMGFQSSPVIQQISSQNLSPSYAHSNTPIPNYSPRNHALMQYSEQSLGSRYPAQQPEGSQGSFYLPQKPQRSAYPSQSSKGSQGSLYLPQELQRPPRSPCSSQNSQGSQGPLYSAQGSPYTTQQPKGSQGSLYPTQRPQNSPFPAQQRKGSEGPLYYTQEQHGSPYPTQEPKGSHGALYFSNEPQGSPYPTAQPKGSRGSFYSKQYGKGSQTPLYSSQQPQRPPYAEQQSQRPPYLTQQPPIRYENSVSQQDIVPYSTQQSRKSLTCLSQENNPFFNGYVDEYSDEEEFYLPNPNAKFNLLIENSKNSCDTPPDVPSPPNCQPRVLPWSVDLPLDRLMLVSDNAPPGFKPRTYAMIRIE